MIKKVIIATALVLSYSTIRPATVDYEISCLARNIFYEARGEPYLGKLAVAQVTLNRVKHKNYPNTICGVVFQRKQFSWTAEKLKEPIKDIQLFEDIAIKVINANHPMKNLKATHFHAKHVQPYWTRTKVYVLTVGNHIFYE